jgi:hypothetical protein
LGRTAGSAGTPVALTAAQASLIVTNGIVVTYGSSVPSSPSNNDLWFETTVGFWWIYNSTVSKWLSLEIYALDGAANGNTVDVFTAGRFSLERMNLMGANSFYGFYLIDYSATPYVNTVNSSVSYWDIVLYKEDSTGVATALSTIGTSGDTVATLTPHSNSINTVYPRGTSYRDLIIVTTKAGSTKTPGPLYCGMTVNLRIAR